MLLLAGPAGSGKTYRILENFRDALRRRDAGVRLLTPTATMAQHLQNQVAREGFVFRPTLIQTLSHFVDAFAGDLPQVSKPLLYLIVETAAARVNHPDFARVARLPGFCAALARSIDEFSSAGCDADRLAASLSAARAQAPLGDAFLAVYREVDRELRRRGWATRSERLWRAAGRIEAQGVGSVHTVWMDGFYALPDPELAVIRAIARHADVTLSLPTAAVTEPSRRRLHAMGFIEEARGWEPSQPRTELCAAPSIEREADEIARRILAQVAAGRQFRDVGVIVRSPEIYVLVLRATLDRFGIPARFYFDADLSHHALVRYLAGTVDALLGGWDFADTLAAIRLAPGVESDEFDFAVRQEMPSAGLAALRHIAGAGSPVDRLLARFETLEPWRSELRTPAEWAARLGELYELSAPGPIEPSTFDVAQVARGQAAALELFDSAMQDAASAFDPLPVPLGAFWQAAKSVLRLTPLRIGDGRRNVVHVLDAHEARQWRLPIIFVCGLIERQFPKFHAQDPFFPDAARAQLNQAGIRLRTAGDFEAEERFLFDCAVTRATESLTLSYPRCDARGQQNLASLYLEGIPAEASEWKSVLPKPARPAASELPRAVINSPDLLANLAARHQAFKPTALESYLQCAFQFFGRYTLRLEGAPARPQERLDFLTQGNIVHAVLARLPGSRQPLEEIFDAEFARFCADERVPPGYRTEAARERMLSDLRALLADPAWTSPYEIRVEQKFQYKLRDDIEIRGRIDRVEVTADGGAFVTDYKYSGVQNTKDRATDENSLQPQLYLLALERYFGLRPEGMRYLGFKGAVRATELVAFNPAPTIATTLRVADEIRRGRVEPHPADPDKCRYCDFRDVCRYKIAAVELAEGASEWD